MPGIKSSTYNDMTRPEENPEARRTRSVFFRPRSFTSFYINGFKIEFVVFHWFSYLEASDWSLETGSASSGIHLPNAVIAIPLKSNAKSAIASWTMNCYQDGRT